ncbi:MAG: response regulator [Chloroflexi bacterium]|nr:response regulator [Chloroflexota bacterium]
MAKVLVIDDEVGLLEEIVEWLHYEGYTVYSASGGAEGVQLARQHLPNLVICDVMMPYFDGYRVLLELRMEETTAWIPVIFLSALAARTDVRRGMNLGAEDYVTKPIARQELLDTIRVRLERSAEGQQQAARTLEQLRLGVLSALPHDLHAPLVGILGFGELLALNPSAYSSAEIAEMAGMIVTSGERLSHLVDRYWLFVQLELGQRQPPLAAVACEACALASQTARRVAELYGRSKDLVVEVTDAMAAIEAEGLEKVVYELVDNAFKHSKAGSQVRVVGGVEAGDWVLRVANQGRGALPAARPPAVLPGEPGFLPAAGLGWTIVRRLVALYQGTFVVQSQPGEGMEGVVRLPLAGREAG